MASSPTSGCAPIPIPNAAAAATSQPPAREDPARSAARQVKSSQMTIVTNSTLTAWTSARVAFSHGSEANANAAPAMPAAAATQRAVALGDEVAGDQRDEAGRGGHAHGGQQVHAPGNLPDREPRPQPAEDLVRREAGRVEDRERGRHRLGLAGVPEPGRWQHACAGRSRAPSSTTAAAANATARSVYGSQPAATRPLREPSEARCILTATLAREVTRRPHRGRRT